MKRVGIIIVNYNGAAYTRACLDSLFRFHQADELDVIVVDNHSQDGSVEILSKEYPEVTVVAMSENKGFGSANNAGAQKAQSELLFFVNNDTIFIEEAVSALSTYLLNDPKIGIVGPKLLNEDRTFQLSFGDFPSIVSEYRMRRLMTDTHLQQSAAPKGNENRIVDWVTGAGFMMRRSLYESIGGFDEKFFLYFEDIDLNKRVNDHGYQVLYCPFVRLVHLGGRSYGEMNPTVEYEYRRSQLHYYDAHASIAERFLIRCYLAVKYSLKMGNDNGRSFMKKVMKLIRSRQ